jgi:hypothetical protein
VGRTVPQWSGDEESEDRLMAKKKDKKKDKKSKKKGKKKK